MKRYLITDPNFYSSEPKQFLQTLLQCKVKNHIDYICLRDKKTSQYNDLANILSENRTSFSGIKLYLHTHYELASILHFDGVHLPSHQIQTIAVAKSLGLEVVYSAHSLEDALMAQKYGADAITISPIFVTPNKGRPLGLEKLKEINDKISLNCFALGGIISQEQIDECEKTGVYGFASIRYFLK
ncbi:MAG: thiamine phosphate synthase [Sulfurospirillaceae bacterium]|nr:thiamine phosphate synthase [Sulfurospirillaceae bacterium]MDD2826235.1 thiamine phosphate synthase [Sulfurospirillaceae bacterium]